MAQESCGPFDECVDEEITEEHGELVSRWLALAGKEGDAGRPTEIILMWRMAQTNLAMAGVQDRYSTERCRLACRASGILIDLVVAAANRRLYIDHGIEESFSHIQQVVGHAWDGELCTIHHYAEPLQKRPPCEERPELEGHHEQVIDVAIDFYGKVVQWFEVHCPGMLPEV